MLNLYRIDWEWDEYMGAGKYETHKYYEYVLGDAKLGRELFTGLREGDHVANIGKLGFSLKGFLVCARHTRSKFKNLTSRN